MKLLVRSEDTERASAWVEEHGGVLLDADRPAAPGRGEPLLLACLPLEALPDLENEDWVRRVEGARTLHPRLDQARGPVTNLDTALTLHPPGRGS